jgi:SAM-dependent methyltransferase
MATFFRTAEKDARLEVTNRVFWDCTINHIEAELTDGFDIESILDVGCHTGGLLQQLAAKWHPKRLFGIEPLEEARQAACLRLQDFAGDVLMLPPQRWNEIPDRSVDLIIAHEVLYLIEDLEEFFAHVHRVLREDGMSFIVLGCHAENPFMDELCREVEPLGHSVTAHHPLDILTVASKLGLKGFVQPLRTSGWICPDLTANGVKSRSLSALMEHHYKHKLIFLFCHRPTV